MRHISFFMTQEQIRARTKFVTRRLGWNWLTPWTMLQPIEKGQGLKAGESVVRIGGPIIIVGVRREPLNKMIRLPGYGKRECALEGFPDWSPQEFVDFLCKENPGLLPTREITRIEFDYTN